jgi:hypothetical protein
VIKSSPPYLFSIARNYYINQREKLTTTPLQRKAPKYPKHKIFHHFHYQEILKDIHIWIYKLPTNEDITK